MCILFLIYIYFATFFQVEIQAAVPVLKSIQAAQTLKRKIPKLKKLRLLATVVKDVVLKIQKTDLTTIIEITKIAEIVKITKIIKDLRIIKIIIKITIVTEITKIATTKDQVPVQVITTTAAVAVVAVTKSLTKKTDLIEIITKIIEDQDQITDPLTVISMKNQRKTNRGLQKRRLKLKKTTENQSRPVLEVCSALICLPKKWPNSKNHHLVAVQAVNNRQKLPFLPHQVP